MSHLLLACYEITRTLSLANCDLRQRFLFAQCCPKQSQCGSLTKCWCLPFPSTSLMIVCLLSSLPPSRLSGPTDLSVSLSVRPCLPLQVRTPTVSTAQGAACTCATAGSRRPGAGPRRPPAPAPAPAPGAGAGRTSAAAGGAPAPGPPAKRRTARTQGPGEEEQHVRSLAQRTTRKTNMEGLRWSWMGRSEWESEWVSHFWQHKVNNADRDVDMFVCLFVMEGKKKLEMFFFSVRNDSLYLNCLKYFLVVVLCKWLDPFWIQFPKVFNVFIYSVFYLKCWQVLLPRWSCWTSILVFNIMCLANYIMT